VVAYAKTKEVDENGSFIRSYETPVRADSSDPVTRFREMVLIDHYCYQIYGVMRISALHQLPPQGIYVNGDRVLLARMSLLGRFYEIPEYLFISRHHSGQSTKTLPVRLQQPRFRLTNLHGVLPCPEWWDPGKTRAVTLPEFRILTEYFRSIYRTSLAIGQKLRCYFMLLAWIRIRHRKLLKDLIIAADQVLYNLTVPNSASTDLPRDTNRPETTLS
jgi:hypothetical protein